MLGEARNTCLTEMERIIYNSCRAVMEGSVFSKLGLGSAFDIPRGANQLCLGLSWAVASGQRCSSGGTVACNREAVNVFRREKMRTESGVPPHLDI